MGRRRRPIHAQNRYSAGPAGTVGEGSRQVADLKVGGSSPLGHATPLSASLTDAFREGAGLQRVAVTGFPALGGVIRHRAAAGARLASISDGSAEGAPLRGLLIPDRRRPAATRPALRDPGGN